MYIPITQTELYQMRFKLHLDSMYIVHVLQQLSWLSSTPGTMYKANMAEVKATLLQLLKYQREWTMLKALESVLYSGKFSQVQNFMKPPLRASEEIFAVLIFAAPARTAL